jgi:hypothetical protein
VTKALPFTAASIARAIRGAEQAGLRIRSVTVKPDGSIIVDSGEPEPGAIDRRKEPLASWEDA